MLKSKIFFFLLFILFLLNACQKEMLEQETQKESFKSDPLLREIQDSLYNSNLSARIDELGVLRWDEANTFFSNIENCENNFTKVVIPIENTTSRDIENLLVAIKLNSGAWKVNIWGEVYFEILSAITKYETNGIVYQNILQEFEEARERRTRPDLSGSRTEQPECGFFIEFSDGTLIYLDLCGGGGMTILSGPGLTGCGSSQGWEGNAISMTDMNGNVWNLGNPSQGWNSGEYGGFASSWSGDNNSNITHDYGGFNDNNTDSNSGDGSMSGINYTLPMCQNPAFWEGIDPVVYHDFALGIAAIINEYDIPIQNNVPQEANNYCSDCYSISDVYCAAVNSNCVEIVNGTISQAILGDCLLPALESHAPSAPNPIPTDLPQNFAEMVLTNPTAQNLVYRLQLSDIELAIEYETYLAQNTDVLESILHFIEAHPNYEIEQYSVVIGDILTFLQETNQDIYAKKSALVILELLRSLGIENFDGVTTPQFNQAANLYLTPNIINPDFATYCGIGYHIYGQTYPDWSNIKKRLWSFYSSISEGLHLTLDFIGLVPVGGEIADLTNGILYTLEGDGVNAGLSFAAMIPVAGWGATGAKFAFKIVGTSGRKVTLSFAKLAGAIDFGSRDVLRTIMKPLASQNAHHIIPWGKRTNPVVQAAADVGWHPNHSDNGINILKTLHINPNGSFDAHPAYDAMIESRLTDWASSHPGYTPLAVFNELNDLIEQIRAAIAANPTTHINDIIP